jgi:hypothetical protein
MAVRKPQADRSNSGEPSWPRGGDLRRAKAWASFSRGRGDTGTCSGELDRAKSAGHREHGGPPWPSTGEGEIGRTQGATGEIRHGDECLTSGRSSGRLGAVSSELDDRERGHGSLAAAGGVGRARERVQLSEMRQGVCAGHWWGSKKGAGYVGGRRGREIRRRARVRTRRSTASAEGAELTEQAHGAEREERGARGNDSVAGDPGPRDRERGSARAKETGADRSAPLGSERERESACEGELPLTGGVRLSGGAGAWPGWA